MACISAVACPKCHAPKGEACKKSWLDRFFRYSGGVLHDERIEKFLRNR